MFPDSNWLSALKLPLRVIFGVFVGCIFLIVLEHYKVIDTSVLGPIYTASVMVIAIVSGALSITGLMGVVFDLIAASRKPSLLAKRREMRRTERAQIRTEAEKTALARIEYLSENELRYLANALRENSQSFYTYVHSPPVTTLMEKRLVQTFGGTHHQDHYPYTIPDYVWRYLLDHKEEILERDNANQAAAEERKRRERRRPY